MPVRHGAKQKKYRALILCCGLMDRGDDAIGPLCAAALEELKIPARTLEGASSEFLTAFQQAEHVIVVDAIVSGQVAAGTLHQSESADPQFAPQTARCSANGLGLAQAVRLARQLHCLPQSLTLMGLEATQFDWASTLSAPIAAAMPQLIDALVKQWRRLTEMRPEFQRHLALRGR
jgi:hydrogenase maturation protease